MKTKIVIVPVAIERRACEMMFCAGEVNAVWVGVMGQEVVASSEQPVSKDGMRASRWTCRKVKIFMLSLIHI